MKKIILLLILIAPSLFGQVLYQYENLKFESGYVDDVPLNWKYTRQQKEESKQVLLNSDSKLEGKMCLKMSNPLNLPTTEFSLTSQSIDAFPYRNKRVRFHAAVKVDYKSPKASAELWIHVKSKKDTVDAEVRMLNNPIKAPYWQYYWVEIVVPVDCIELKFGFMLNGPGTAYFDDASLEIVQPYFVKIENYRDISDEKVDQYLAFAKAYGLVHYFYPGTENSEADWTRILVNAVEFIDKNNLETTELLTRTLQPFAYLAQFSNKKINSREIFHHKDALKSTAYSWIHKGAYAPRSKDVYFSELFETYKSYIPREAAVIQSVNTRNLKNKKVVFSASIKTDLFNPGSQAQLWVRGDDIKRLMVLANATFENPATDKEWKRYELTTFIPDSVENLRLGLVLLGAGKVWFDDIKLVAISADGKKEDIYLKNHSFEDQNSGEIISRGWLLPDYVTSSGYTCQITDKQFSKDRKCLEICSDTNYVIKVPYLGEYFNYELNDKLWASIPLSLESDSTGTLPRSSRSFRDLSSRTRQFQPVVEDRNSRIGQLIDEFANIYYFALRNDLDRKKLSDKFKECIRKTALIKDDYYTNQFKLMRELLSVTNDAQARLWHNDKRKEYSTPLLFKKIDNKVIITKIDENPQEIRAGDEIIKFNGLEINSYLENSSKLLPGTNIQLKYNILLAEIRSGKYGEIVTYTIKKEDGNTVDYTLEKTFKIEFMMDDRPPSFSLIAKNIIYIDLTSCTDQMLWDFLEKYNANSNYIFDLRGNCRVSEHFLGYFIKNSIQSLKWYFPIYTKPFDYSSSFQKIDGIIEKTGNKENAKLVFLCDERSIGFSEVILRIVKDNNLGNIIGSRSAGMPGDAVSVRIIGGFNISYTPSWDYENSIQYKGIEPVVKVLQDIESIKSASDKTIEKALELLSN